jgi:fumarate hydratase subunit alpha
MKTIRASDLGPRIESLCLEISTVLPQDVLEALSRARQNEKSESARKVIDLIIENARVAGEMGVPLCQDTGMFTVFLTLGGDACLEGDLEVEAARAVARATAGGSLRPSVVADPVDGRANTGDNTPPLVEVDVAFGGQSTLAVMAKGGGCENASRLGMLPAGAGWPGVLRFVRDVAAEVGACACPPLVLGVGIGGSFDRAPKLAKKSLLETLDRENPDPVTAAREREVVDEVNRLGFGPGALGGTVTCIGARIASAPCHMATLPVAVSVNCHELRRKVIPI